MSLDFLYFLPETVILVGALVTFIVAMTNAALRTTWSVATLFSGAAAVVSLAALGYEGEPFFKDIYRVDAFSQILKLALTTGLLLVLLLSDRLAGIRRSAWADIPTFLLLTTAGMMMLVSAVELLTLYVALEMSAYGLFILVGVGRMGPRPMEAAAKYVLFGAAASALTLYGISLIFGATGTTYLSHIVLLPAATLGSPLFVVGVVLMLSGLLFKLAVFPFHSWAPDVYEGAPNEVVAFLGTASKVAAVGVIGRALTVVWHDPGHMVTLLAILSVASMTFGNLAALVQRDVKRLLAYSTIAHGGYLMIGFLVFSPTGIAATIFYSVSYMLMAFCAFAVVCVVAPDGRSPTFADLEGLHARSPFLGIVLLVGLFGLAGIPPTPGFAGKWFLFSAGLEKGHFFLVLVAAVNATVSLYYYLTVLKAAYFTSGENRETLDPSVPVVVATGGAAALSLAIGFWPGPVWDMAREAALALVGG